MTQLDNFAQKARTCEGAACQQVTQDMVDTNLKQQKEILQAAKDITLSASAIQTDGALTLAAGGYHSMLWVRT